MRDAVPGGNLPTGSRVLCQVAWSSCSRRGKVIPNSMSAEPMSGADCNTPDDDNSLMQEVKSTGNLNQPRLRIVHSADRFPAPASVNMPPPDRRHNNSN